MLVSMTFPLFSYGLDKEEKPLSFMQNYLLLYPDILQRTVMVHYVILRSKLSAGYHGPVNQEYRAFGNAFAQYYMP
ncbi:hypothetical protein AFLA_012089 [Aspergillus flavus NRRL3357]|nr:hypothetical protein AFLA_012089 [Aspergillus flavus NRRL3357]